MRKCISGLPRAESRALAAYGDGSFVRRDYNARVHGLNTRALYAIDMPPPEDIDLDLLREIAADPATSQRSLARRLGVSLGRVNFCLRALADKGLVKANNFRRSDNKRAYAYVLTPKGVDEKVRLTVNFLQRKMIEYDRLQVELESLRREVGELTKNS